MFVKICGITNEEDALLAVAVGADAVGFIFAPSTRQVPVNRVAEIVKRLPPEVLTVGVFRNETPSRVIALVHQAGLGAAQLHGAETPDHVREVKAEVRTVFKAVTAGTEAFERAGQFGADAVLVDGPTPGSGELFDWRLAEGAPFGLPLILAGGLNPDNVGRAIEKVRPWGVDVASGVERSAGKKDALLVRDFVKAARAAADSISAPSDPGSTSQDPHSAPTNESAFGPEPYDWQEDPSWR